MLLTLWLTAALAASPDTVSEAPSAEPAERPAVVVHRQPAVPLVSLRLSILADDPPGYAGAGHLLQHIAYPRLQEQVARIGGRVKVERTSDAIVYILTGPRAELPYLAGILRSVVAPPAPADAELLRASHELSEERLAEWETAARHVRGALRAQLFPEDLPAAGTQASGGRLSSAEALRSAWAGLYRPDRVSVIAVGDVRVEEVEAALGELPPAPGGFTPPALDTVPVQPLAPAEATQAWLAVGYPADELPPAAVSALTRMAGDAVREQLPGATVEAEHWWSHHGQAVVLVAAVSGDGIERARTVLGEALAGALDAASPAVVRDAARAARHEMLFYSRTTERMAEVLGRFSDRGGDPDAAQRFYAALHALDPEEVVRALESLLNATPRWVVIPPQELPEASP